MEQRDPLEDKNDLTVLYANELDDDSEHAMLEPVADSSNKDNGFNKAKVGSTMDESSPSRLSVIPRSKPRFSLLQEFDPLCACDNTVEKETVQKETVEKEIVKKETIERETIQKEEVEKEKVEKETVEDLLLRVSDDALRDTHSIPEERILEADETETDAACICLPAEKSESCTTLTGSVEDSDVIVIIRPDKSIHEIYCGPSASEETIQHVEYDQYIDSLPAEVLMNINAEKSDIFYPTVEHPDEHNTDADTSQYLDTLSTTHLEDSIQNFNSADEKSKNSEESREFDSLRLAAIHSISSMTDAQTKKIMSDLTEKMDQQQRELSEVKLQLNALIQTKAGLELQLSKKDEVVLKAQAELYKIDAVHKQELKQVREEYKAKLMQKGGSKSLEEELKECKAREAKALAELSQKSKAISSFEKSLDQYERQLAKVLADHSKEVEEHEITKRHLASLELAFSDVHSKYEKSKEVIKGYVTNEETLVAKLELALATNVKHEEKYESLKTHAKNQIDKSNSEILSLKEKDDAEIGKLKAVVKVLEITCAGLEVQVQQKIEECEQLRVLLVDLTENTKKNE